MTPALETAIREFAGQSEGWVEADRCVELAQLILDHKPQVVVEIGVFGGRSFIPQAMALRENGSGIIYGIDPWKKDDALEGENEANKQWWGSIDLEEIHRGCMRALWKYDLGKHAVVIRSASHHCADLWLWPDIPIDFLNIDGNHSEVASCRDVDLYLPKVAAGGLIHFDDCQWPSTQAALKKLDEACEKIKDGIHYRIYRKPTV